MDNLTVIDLDLRGKACPGPVVETRKTFLSLDKEADEVIITVQLDNQAACLNVTRFAESQNFMVSQEVDAEGMFTLTITRGFSCELPPSEIPKSPCPETPNHYIVYIDSSNMGSGDEKLGSILMKAFLKTLPELENLPKSIIFLNDGVFLTTTDSPEIKSIQALETAGCTILVCGTCLDFYHLKDKLAVGQISNMFEIASLMTGSDRVVRT
ncbi:MAG: sulfurtransferase-like selenium metabolism protein YedF [Deltaproteobacteria bacterium]|nr:sulfurtransferase-like selenium metabolism protein YedF [Deltaproteobacteria bacterium]